MNTSDSLRGHCESIAYPSLAFIKYWGKSDVERNLPATPSLAITLNQFQSRTYVELHAEARDSHNAGTSQDSDDSHDTVIINGQEQDYLRFNAFFNEFRNIMKKHGKSSCILIHARSWSNFPVAAGLASSSSGFAALAMACLGAADLQLPVEEVSALARLGSASAARSLWGGFTCLNAGASSATCLHPADFWPDLRVIVLQVESGPKKISSREAMEITRKSSPYYQSWVEDAPQIMEKAIEALKNQNLETLGPLIRTSYLRMFSTMFAADPPVIYWTPLSLSLIQLCEELRKTGIAVWETMDAGPQLKLFSTKQYVENILDYITASLPQIEYHVCACGPGACIKEK